MAGSVCIHDSILKCTYGIDLKGRHIPQQRLSCRARHSISLIWLWAKLRRSRVKYAREDGWKGKQEIAGQVCPRGRGGERVVKHYLNYLINVIFLVSTLLPITRR